MRFQPPHSFEPQALRRQQPASVRRWLALLLSVLLLTPVSAALAGVVKTEHVTAELLARNHAVQPGQSVQVGLRLQHIPHWHTYWRNPGDSGLPTTIEWTLPAGATMGAIDWPAPKRLPIGPLVNYGYEDDLLLPMRFTAPADAQPGSVLELRAQATWLVCRDICIPENATLKLSLPVAEPGAAPGSSESAALFDRALAQKAMPLQGWTATLQHSGAEMLLQLDRQGGKQAAAAPLPAIHVFPYAEQLIEPAQHELYSTPTGYAVRLRVAANASVPPRFDAIAVLQSANGEPTRAIWNGPHPSVEFSAPVQAVAAITLPVGAALLAASNASAADRSKPAGALATEQLAGQAPLGLLAALLLALIGGMVLNLMPCVFPVLSIKLLSLSQHDPSRSALRTHAAAYSAGVVVSFIALAGALLGLRAAGSAVGWGFQLQEPGVVFVLALLFFALGLNLMGAFEFGNLLPQRLARWRASRPAADAFGAGVLAVVAASPCTAPFMGAALGFAVTQSTTTALAVFAVLGIGMALPYAALVVLPGWRSRLPKPGAWMLRLKQLLAFPMFATVVWLIWVLGLQAGIDGAAKALLALVGLAFAVWASGSLRKGSGVSRAGNAIGMMALAALLVWSWPATLSSSGPGDHIADTRRIGDGKATIWQTYSDDALRRQLAEGRPVFVDFTAAWCVSCQVNKQLVLNTQGAQLAFARSEVALMRADWTRRDADITEALARLGRNGVPVYALHRPGKEPLLLPEILTLGVLRDALSTLQPRAL